MQAVIRHKIILFLVLSMLVLPNGLHAQSAEFSGSVVSEDGPLEYASIIFKDIQVGGITNAEGIFEVLNVPAGTHWVEISSTGYVSFSDSITFREGRSVQRHFRLKPDLLNLSQTVVTGTRNRVERYNSPVIVNTIDAAVFELTQSINVADGLNFSPGLRVENNCQNCGFTQLRMNGLDGPYSQILINSRPIFSALAGVYGLEMLPANMVDRIEVVRGGGSVMYGGNAIAGTVNILTKNPVKNTFDAGINQSLIYGETSDRTINFNGSVVSEDLKKGISFFGFNRNRDNWDANGDGFSEMVALRNNTFGFDAFYALNDQSTIKLGTYYINEFRRGGNKFNLFPHQSDITEQLEHDILSTNLGYEYLSKNNRHKLNVYASLQHVNRTSYYGGGGRVLGQGDTLTPDDILAINAYGSSTDLSTITGLQYNVFLNPKMTVLLGTEYVYNDVLDEMPGYGRVIDQQVGTLGSFAELEIKPTSKLTFLVGGRFDHLNIQGNYNLAEERFTNEKNLNVFVPRMTALYNMKENLKLRASFAQGYRGPQAFDEDLHIETVGGAARFIRINPNLEVERSNSAVLSLNYDKYLGKNQMNFVLEGFYTRLTNPFIFADQQELPSGVAVIAKRNGDGATVSGINLEANYAFSSKLILQSGATLQTGVYDVEEELWAPDDPSENTQTTTTRRLLRTPNAYGYYSLVYNPTKAMTFSYSGVLTGTMDVPHVIDAETERTVLKSTPVFFENNIKVGYAFQTSGDYKVEVFGGVQNLLNSYQEDFDLGANRDAGYVYGPIRPRTFFMGLKFGLE
jgi:outer membrane receptor for ferrienterochelin and colicins